MGLLNCSPIFVHPSIFPFESCVLRFVKVTTLETTRRVNGKIYFSFALLLLTRYSGWVIIDLRDEGNEKTSYENVMKIQHNSPEKIEQVEPSFSFALRGCLCFAEEGHNYSLNAGHDKYAYLIDVENILDITSIWFDHTQSEISELITEMCEDLEIDEDTACELIDETKSIMDDANKSWLIQQFQGKIAHELGYDCAMANDEQGTVYIAYCVNREMKEIAKEAK